MAADLHLKNTLREFIRHLLFVSGMSQLLYFYRVLKKRDSLYLQHAELSERFSEIYRDKRWVWQEDQPLSGRGSTLKATEKLRLELPRIFEELGIETLVDVGCGDFGWMKEIDRRPTYIGMDIVADVIADNQRKYASDKISFLCADAINDDIPACDAVLCREILFHLSFSDIKKLLRRVKASGARYILATTDDDTRFNADIASGDYRILNLRISPFRFPRPLIARDDNVVSAYRKLAVWRIADCPI